MFFWSAIHRSEQFNGIFSHFGLSKKEKAGFLDSLFLFILGKKNFN